MSRLEMDATVVPIDELPQLRAGTAYVQDVQVDTGQTIVRLSYPFGRRVLFQVPGVPQPADRVAPAALRRVLAVQIRATPRGVACSAVGTSWNGPRRTPLTLMAALALAGDGVHTVVLTD